MRPTEAHYAAAVPSGEMLQRRSSAPADDVPELDGGVLTLDRTYPPEPESVTRARHDVGEVLGPRVGGSDVAVIVSELASNAVKHARTPFRLRLVQVDDSVLVRVDDSLGEHVVGTGPAVVEASPDAPHGRGLALVSALAQRWGVRSQPSGTCAWALLALGPPS